MPGFVLLLLRAVCHRSLADYCGSRVAGVLLQDLPQQRHLAKVSCVPFICRGESNCGGNYFPRSSRQQILLALQKHLSFPNYRTLVLLSQSNRPFEVSYKQST
jgi:hypothetical protein